MITAEQNVLFGACVKQAREFLKMEGDLMPFAFALNNFGEVVSIAAYAGNLEADPLAVIAFLEQAIKDRDVFSPIKGAAICVDVLATPPGMGYRCDALEIRISMRGQPTINRYLPYQKTEEGALFGQGYTEPGTMQLW